jgi:chromosome segregation protein
MKAGDFEPAKQGKILGLVADFIRVDSRYERAAEAALGDKLQWIMVESQDDGSKAVSYLRERGKGKGSFVPAAQIRGHSEPGSPASGLPFLRDLINIKDTHEKPLCAVIGSVLVAETLNQAVTAWHKDGKTFSYVTIEGDMVDAQGVITGGRLGAASFNLLSRRREMESLEKEITVLEKKVSEVRDSMEEMEDRLQQSSETVEEMTEQRFKAQEEINQLDNLLRRIGQEWDQHEKLAARVKDDLSRKDKEEGKSREALSKVKEQLKEVQGRRLQKETLLKSKEAELKEAESEYELLREELGKIKASQSALREEQKGLTRETERIERFIHESTKRLGTLEEEIENCRTRCLRCRRESEEIRTQLAGVFERLRGAEEDLHSCEHARQELQASVKEKESAAEKVRSEIQAVREEINNIKMAHAELQFKTDALRESVREKWDLNLEAIYRDYLIEDFSQPSVDEEINRQKEFRSRLGEVNLTAIKEHAALEERCRFMEAQKEDLLKSIESLRVAIRKINQTSVEKFTSTFKEVDIKLKEVFPLLFNGGTAGLVLTDESSPLESGVLVQVQLPGKRVSHMGLLSGGEKALVAMALLFSIYMIRPSPFCLLDEVDAPLDEANVDRFNNLLREIKRNSQIIMVTHKRRSMEITDRLYGITMEKIGISKVVSVDMKGITSRGGAQALGAN